MSKKLKYDPSLKVKIFKKGTKGPVMEVYSGSDFSPFYHRDEDSYYYVTNKPFKAKMTLVKFVKTASSFKLVLKDENDIHYFMRHTDFTNMVLKTDIINATVEDTFVFITQANFPYLAPLLGRELCPVSK